MNLIRDGDIYCIMVYWLYTVRRTQIGPTWVLADSDIWGYNRADTHTASGTLYKPCTSNPTHCRCQSVQFISLVELNRDVCRPMRCEHAVTNANTKHAWYVPKQYHWLIDSKSRCYSCILCAIKRLWILLPYFMYHIGYTQCCGRAMNIKTLCTLDI